MCEHEHENGDKCRYKPNQEYCGFHDPQRWHRSQRYKLSKKLPKTLATEEEREYVLYLRKKREQLSKELEKVTRELEKLTTTEVAVISITSAYECCLPTADKVCGLKGFSGGKSLGRG
ncbi:hypothetical protein COEREDRAFT_90142 [Coemansia reversa NRRL 1564]|uniref:Uncharacterized protein n=1 Tax=Coemansia reversa (strain ATCC 12441 / NRRL 1564) TaxID=763665 RepID=A0A2G5B0R4_COERN|nr:hypothetical protein COEREDRAFT_90142 [Coemansia reversa NRRL 1564]|eukprot:PIA12616.1 hypothetical protein COEREDRAFT_90142 [Coemansia reversa NRRL 1564]